jgi:hypothetical protein
VYVSLFWLASRFVPGLREMRDLGSILVLALLWSAGFLALRHQYPRMKRWFERCRRPPA